VRASKIALGRAKAVKVRSTITAADAVIMTRVSAANSPVLDRALPALSRAANYSRLWMGIAAALAAAVGASRVVTGVHFPSDVAAGFAIGTCAGVLTVRWWPLRRSEPAAATRPRRDAPAAPTGKGLRLVINCAAGTASDELTALLQEELPDARIVSAADGDELPELIAEAASGARILGIAGGDGSEESAASRCWCTARTGSCRVRAGGGDTGRAVAARGAGQTC
jgi:hypothetical protein